jgi:hypothetical protein
MPIRQPKMMADRGEQTQMTTLNLECRASSFSVRAKHVRGVDATAFRVEVLFTRLPRVGPPPLFCPAAVQPWAGLHKPFRLACWPTRGGVADGSRWSFGEKGGTITGKPRRMAEHPGEVPDPARACYVCTEWLLEDRLHTDGAERQAKSATARSASFTAALDG